MSPLLLGGLAAFLVPRDSDRRRALLFVTIWAGTGLAAAILSLFVSIPAHRVLSFGLGIPILATGGVVGLDRVLMRFTPQLAGKSIAFVVASLFLAGSMWAAREGWRPPPASRQQIVAQAEAASRYVDRTSDNRPIVFVIDPRGPDPYIQSRLLFDTIKAALEPDQILRSYLHVGDPTDLLAGRPTVSTNHPEYTLASRRFWEETRVILQESPLLIQLQALNRARFSAGDAAVLVGGPQSEVPVSSTPASASPPVWELMIMVLAGLGLLFAVGIGWAIGLIPDGWLGRVALAPALGIAALIVGGLIGGYLGVSLPAHRPLSIGAISVGGWILPLIRARSARSQQRPKDSDG